MSQTLQRADPINRKILESALVDHEKHYRALCLWIARDLVLNKRRRRDWSTGAGALSVLLAEGHTAATVIWEVYGPKEQKWAV